MNCMQRHTNMAWGREKGLPECEVWRPEQRRQEHREAAQIRRRHYQADASKDWPDDWSVRRVDLQKVVMLPRMLWNKTAIFTKCCLLWNICYGWEEIQKEEVDTVSRLAWRYCRLVSSGGNLSPHNSPHNSPQDSPQNSRHNSIDAPRRCRCKTCNIVGQQLHCTKQQLEPVVNSG